MSNARETHHTKCESNVHEYVLLMTSTERMRDLIEHTAIEV